MPVILTCPLCQSGRWEDQKYPGCLKQHNTQARLNVLRDAQDYGAGYSRTLADGTIEYLRPQDVMLKNPDEVEEPKA